MIDVVVKKQREYFNSGITKDYHFRRDSLLKLRNEIVKNKNEIINAFIKDFNKHEFDVIATELGMVIMEIDYFLKNLKKLMKRKKKKTSIINFPSKGYIYNEPYGVVLIMSPWNYPFQLSLIPLVGAIASGNTVILKPSAYSSNVSNILKQLLSIFSDDFVYVVLGGRDVNKELLDHRFDFIFFTGGDSVGRLVMEKASKNLTPICLELGGKSPCIVDKSANLSLAAKRIIWGKFLNAGQTCVAPDYLLVDEAIKDDFIKLLINETIRQNYQDNKLRSDFCHIINDKHVNRLISLIDKDKVIFGGKVYERILEPTILDNITRDDAVMQEEIFGPILPIMTFKNIDEVINDYLYLDKPLALYYFSNDSHSINKVLSSISFGGGCINDTIMHLTNENLPFGGVGKSGMGNYHGKRSYQMFTHEKSVLFKSKTELNTKYPPYKLQNQKLIEKIARIK